MPEAAGKAGASPYEILENGYNVVMERGFDFAEATVGLVMNLTETEVEKASRSLKFEMFNSFIPPSLPIAATPLDTLTEYAEKAMRRVKALGASGVVFGSGAARRIPDGSTWENIRKFIIMCGGSAEKYGLFVALEPLNSHETNWLTTVREGFEICEELNLPSIKLLADAFHMAKENESPLILPQATKFLAHIHVSDADRGYPGRDGGEYLKTIAGILNQTGYRNGISAECGYGDFTAESKYIYKFMKEVFT